MRSCSKMKRAPRDPGSEPKVIQFPNPDRVHGPPRGMDSAMKFHKNCGSRVLLQENYSAPTGPCTSMASHPGRSAAWCGRHSVPTILGADPAYACYFTSALGPVFLAIVLASAVLQGPKLRRLRSLLGPAERRDGWARGRAACSAALALIHLAILILALTQVPVMMWHERDLLACMTVDRRRTGARPSDNFIPYPTQYVRIPYLIFTSVCLFLAWSTVVVSVKGRLCCLFERICNTVCCGAECVVQWHAHA